MQALPFLSPALLIGKMAFGSKPKAPQTVLPAQRDPGRVAQTADDAMLRRRGAAADMLTGSTGAEAPQAGVKTLLGN